MSRLLWASVLFLLAPLVAEFLLGNLPVTALPLLIVLAPLYGGGALLIREVTRRVGRGWPTIVMLALAYGVLEEGLITMSLFNPNYAGQRLLDNGFVPALGIGVPWTLYVLSLHTIWSISVPIALVEAMAGSRSPSAWLGRLGLAVTGAVFLAGCFAVAAFSRAGESFAPSVWQLGGSALIVVGLVTLAFRLPRAWGSPVAGSAPRGWLVGLASLVATSLFKMLPFQRVEPWLYAALFAALAVAGLVVVVRWSRMRGWGEAHRLALAGGALLTYAWSGFPEEPVLPVDPFIDLVGNALFALGAVAVLAIAIRRVSASERREPPAAANRSLPRGAVSQTEMS